MMGQIRCECVNVYSLAAFTRDPLPQVVNGGAHKYENAESSNVGLVAKIKGPLTENGFKSSNNPVWEGWIDTCVIPASTQPEQNSQGPPHQKEVEKQTQI